MSDRDSFLRAIIAQPDDNLPRLVFADFLDEHGEPERAEFIRVQCELAPLAGRCERGDGLSSWCMGAPERHHPDCRTGRLRQRERELLSNIHSGDWLGELGKGGCTWPGAFSHQPVGEVAFSLPNVETHFPSGFVGIFARGFVSRITCSWSDWSRHADAILAACPIRGAKDGCVTLTDLPLFSAILNGGRTQMLELDGGNCRLGLVFAVHQHCIGRPAQWGLKVAADLLAAEWPGVRFDLPARELYTLNFNSESVTFPDVRSSDDDSPEIREFLAGVEETDVTMDAHYP